VVAGAAWSVSTGEELERLLTRVQRSGGAARGESGGGGGGTEAVGRRMRRAQERLCEHHDGAAAQRVWRSLAAHATRWHVR
jgi:hypothetical protein